MPGYKRKRHAHAHSTEDADLLQSIQRDDGLWESIEQDEETLLDSENDANPPPVVVEKEVVVLMDSNDNIQDMRRSSTPQTVELKSTGTQTLFIASNQPTILSSTSIAVTDTAATGIPSGDVDRPSAPPVQRRGRGRPRKNKPPANDPPSPEKASESSPPNKKRTNEPSVHRRHVRFTEPVPSDAEPQLRRDSHVFVRLGKVLVNLPAQPPNNSNPTQVSFIWNNRAKAWKLTGDRGSEGMVELHGLLEQPPERLSIVHPFVSPTERAGGVRQPVEMKWDPATFCFQGLNQDNELISITLGEMKDMAKDPWKRQYVGYIMSY